MSGVGCAVRTVLRLTRAHGAPYGERFMGRVAAGSVIAACHAATLSDLHGRPPPFQGEGWGGDGVKDETLLPPMNLSP